MVLFPWFHKLSAADLLRVSQGRHSSCFSVPAVFTFVFFRLQLQCEFDLRCCGYKSTNRHKKKTFSGSVDLRGQRSEQPPLFAQAFLLNQSCVVFSL